MPSTSMSPEISSEANVPIPAVTLPIVPLNTSELFVAAVKNVNADALSS